MGELMCTHPVINTNEIKLLISQRYHCICDQVWHGSYPILIKDKELSIWMQYLLTSLQPILELWIRWWLVRRTAGSLGGRTLLWSHQLCRWSRVVYPVRQQNETKNRKIKLLCLRSPEIRRKDVYSSRSKCQYILKWNGCFVRLWNTWLFATLFGKLWTGSWTLTSFKTPTVFIFFLCCLSKKFFFLNSQPLDHTFIIQGVSIET